MYGSGKVGIDTIKQRRAERTIRYCTLQHITIHYYTLLYTTIHYYTLLYTVIGCHTPYTIPYNTLYYIMSTSAATPEYKVTSSPLGDNDASSMIFERNVEEPCSGRQFSRNGSTVSLLSRQQSDQSFSGSAGQGGLRSGSGQRTSRTSATSSTSGQGSPPDSPELLPSNAALDHRRHLENFVAPSLDASCSVIADNSEDLKDWDVVYMKRPSTIGLDLALGRTRSNSYSTLKEEQLRLQQRDQLLEEEKFLEPQQSQYPRSNSSGQSFDQNLRTLRFYSYADMLSDEMATSPTNKARPTLPHSASSSFLRPTSQHQPMHFSNPFKPSTATNGSAMNNVSSCGCGGAGRLRKDSMTSPGNLNVNMRKYSNNLLSRSPTSQTTTSLQPQQQQQQQSVSSPAPSLGLGKPSRLAKPRRRSGFKIESNGSDEFSTDEEDGSSFSSVGQRVSRTSTQNSAASQTSSQRGGSVTSGSPSLMRKRESVHNSISGLLMEDTLQTEKVGDILKQRMGTLKKQDLKVTTGEE